MGLILNGVLDEFDNRAVLVAAGFDDCEHRFHVPVATCTLGAEAQFSPDHAVTQASLSSVIGRFNFGITQERPQVIVVSEQLLARPTCGRSDAAQQVLFHFLADRTQISLQCRVLDRPVAAPGILGEQLSCFPHQVMTQTFELIVIRIDQFLEIAFQVRPAPLQGVELKIHFRAIAVDAARELVTDRFTQHDRFAGRSDNEHSEACCHKRPQPRFHATPFERRLIDRKVRLLGKCCGKLLVIVFQGCCGSCFELADVTSTAGHVADLSAEERRLAS